MNGTLPLLKSIGANPATPVPTKERRKADIRSRGGGLIRLKYPWIDQAGNECAVANADGPWLRWAYLCGASELRQRPRGQIWAGAMYHALLNPRDAFAGLETRNRIMALDTIGSNRKRGAMLWQGA